MRLPTSIRDNLHFLIAEVGSQVANLQSFFDTGSAILGRRVLDRSGYAYNLKIRIHNSCLAEIANGRRKNAETFNLRAVESIATDLERITELCRDCVRQAAYLRRRECLRIADFSPMMDLISEGIERIGTAVTENDTALALKIGAVEHKLDRDYRRMLRRGIRALKKKRHTQDLITVLFAAHAVEQMGDALLNVSEAVISANLGQPINTDRYYSLKASMEQLQVAEASSGLVVEPVAETRSGSGISAIARPDADDDGYVAIFKDGKKSKVKEEREGVESWHEIYPGLAPRILSYHKRGESAALLIEHLAGLTFEQILLNESKKRLDQALARLHATLESIWRETHSRKRVAAGFMQQMKKRLPDVYSVHPEFRRSDSRIGACRVPAFESLAERCRQLEDTLKAPFAVYIHGDFNVDNIIYDPVDQRINFIDLHRSAYMDYVQDVSVFMVSNYRLQVLDEPVRRRIVDIARAFHAFAAGYAQGTQDKTFEMRLALGLSRSFATSTRFIMDKSLAGAMFMRARYLMERVLEADPKQPEKFTLPVEDLFSG